MFLVTVTEYLFHLY